MTSGQTSDEAICFVGLGSNLGDGADTLNAALRSLAALPDTRILQASSLYRTPAWGVTAQPDFTNAVAMLVTALPPGELLVAMLGIERAAGRVRRDDGSDRWGARTLDLDLLMYGQQQIDQPGLRVPHPHLHERAFALVPLVEIAPGTVIPGVGMARDALAGLAIDDIQALTYAGPAVGA